LVTQVTHGKILYKKIKKFDSKVQLLTGEVNCDLRTKLIKQMKNGDLNIIIGTSLADEGLDIPILDTLILAGGGKSSVKALQRVGRILRLHQDKNNPIVIDFNDNAKFLLSHSRKRWSIYKTEEEFKIVY
jgi:superfamily II DNA or RNA helicase